MMTDKKSPIAILKVELPKDFTLNMIIADRIVINVKYIG